MKHLAMLLTLSLPLSFACGVQDEPAASEAESAESVEQGVTSSCLSMYVRRCDGSQFSNKEGAKKYCDNYCASRKYPVCSHLYVSCGFGVGVTCRCLVPFGGQ